MGMAPTTRAHDSICIFHSSCFGFRGAFVQFLIRFAVKWPDKDV